MKQLASQQLDLPAKVNKLYEKFQKDQKRPALDEVYAALLEVSKLFNRVFLIFDALDECDKTSQRPELLRLFRLMGKEGISVFVTSRPHSQDIKHGLREAVKVELSAQRRDIELYIREKINNNMRIKDLIQTDTNLTEKIVSGLVESAKGMWVAQDHK